MFQNHIQKQLLKMYFHSFQYYLDCVQETQRQFPIS